MINKILAVSNILLIVIAGFLYFQQCPPVVIDAGRIFEGEAKLALVKHVYENELDNKKPGYVGRPSIKITWDEIHRYYIDLEDAKWKIEYSQSNNTVNISVPELKYFPPTIISETIIVDVDPALFKKEWKVLRDQFNKMGKISRAAIKATLNDSNSNKQEIMAKVESSLKSQVNKYFSSLGLPDPNIVLK